ncbi:MAG TPA: winged helix-turn-helix domain-containing protein [Pyrinomonadaceae bacterium]|nr:winged helix-turn-helix domain-containing protein [Pyrinomonadaceae bacterium]
MVYEFGPFLLEPQVRRLSRNGETVSLAAPEFELLLLLVRNHGRVVGKSEIMETVWPDVDVEDNNLTVRMSSLRRALGEKKGYHPYIQTVTGRGYCLIAQVKELPEQPETNTHEPIGNNEPEPVISTQPVSAVGPQVEPTRSARLWIALAFSRKPVWLYALLLVLLLSASIVIAWRWQRTNEASSQSMKMSRITHTGQVAAAAISPDGQTIAYVERDVELSSLWIQRIGTNNPLQLLPPARLLYRDPAFSRDGNMLYYSKCDPDCKLQKMPVLGGVETTLPIRADSSVTFSPDGKRMAYLRVDPEVVGVQLSLLVAHADGTSEETINLRKGTATLYQGGSPAWSPDGKTIAFPILSDDGPAPAKVVGIGVADRKESTLTAKRWRYIHDVTWLPNGDGFIISARDEASTPEVALQIWRISYPDGETRRITNDLNNYSRVAVSADSNTLIAIEMNWTSGLWTAPAENPSAAVQITRGTIDRRDGHLGLSAAPDGRIIYVADFSGKRDLWSVKADGALPVQLTDGPHRDSFPTVTRDGRFIVYESTRDGANSLWRVDADGRNVRRLTSGRYDAEAVCSPDGKWIVYVAHEDGRTVPKLRKVSIEGSHTIPLTNEYSLHPTVSPDGKLIAYYRVEPEKQERRDIVIISAEGGPAVKTLPAPKNFGGAMRWAPSGDALIYRDQTMRSLWRLPLDGSPPSQVMTFRGEQLFTFAYSYDGRRLIYASGPNVRDVILITRFN